MNHLNAGARAGGNMHSQIESGIDLLARLIPRPSLSGLRNQILVEDIQTTDAIEISGDKSTGKTLFLYELIGKCILPKHQNGLHVGGCDASVVLINTEQQFCASKFLEVTRKLVVRECIRNMGHISEDTNTIIKDLVRDSLKKLIVLDCFEYEQFLLTIHTLTDRLLSNTNIAMLAIDSITAHYWSSRQIEGLSSIDQHAKKCLKLIRTSTSRCKVATIYVRLRDTPLNSPKFKAETTLAKISLEIPTHLIILQRLDATGSMRSCSLKTNRGLEKQCTYQMKESGIEWKVESKWIQKEEQ